MRKLLLGKLAVLLFFATSAHAEEVLRKPPKFLDACEGRYGDYVNIDTLIEQGNNTPGIWIVLDGSKVRVPSGTPGDTYWAKFEGQITCQLKVKSSETKTGRWTYRYKTTKRVSCQDSQKNIFCNKRVGTKSATYTVPKSQRRNGRAGQLVYW